MIEKWKELQEKLKLQTPRIHCITNYIAARDCANAILAVGGRPIMAEHPKEVEEITSHSQGLSINLGSISDGKMEAIVRSVQVARKKQIPWILDLTGVGGSTLRRQFAKQIIKEGKPTVIKGNWTEVYAMHQETSFACGVDGLKQHQLTDGEIQEEKEWLKQWAREQNTVLLLTGEKDLVVTKDVCVLVENGSSKMGEITGSGCVLGCLLATFLATLESGCRVEEVVVFATCFYGVCGELADKDCRQTKGMILGSGSFGIRLQDWLQMCGYEEVKKRARYRVL